MKNLLFTLIFSVISLMAFSQASDTTLTQSNWLSIATGSRAFQFDYSTDTLDGTPTPDTITIKIPHIFSSSFMGEIVVSYANVSGNGTGSVILQSAPRSSGPWTTLVTVAYAHDSLTPAPDQFPVPNLYLRALVIQSAENGVPRTTITVKPSSISY
jgi:hypothetical protein